MNNIVRGSKGNISPSVNNKLYVLKVYAYINVSCSVANYLLLRSTEHRLSSPGYSSTKLLSLIVFVMIVPTSLSRN